MVGQVLKADSTVWKRTCLGLAQKVRGGKFTELRTDEQKKCRLASMHTLTTLGKLNTFCYHAKYLYFFLLIFAKKGRYMIFWRKIVIFHTKYPKNFRAPLHSAQFFLSAPPQLEILDPPL